MKNIKAILFDMDGTLADTIPLTIHCISEAVYEKSGRRLSENEVVSCFLGTDISIVRSFVHEQERASAEDLYIDILSQNIPGMVNKIEGMDILLDTLKKQGIQTALFTGRSRRATLIMLDMLGLKTHFDIVICGDDLVNSKPDPEGVYKALDMLGVSACNAAFIGDTEADIQAAKCAGTASLLALWASSADARLTELNPDRSFKTTGEFIKWIESLSD